MGVPQLWEEGTQKRLLLLLLLLLLLVLSFLCNCRCRSGVGVRSSVNGPVSVEGLGEIGTFP